MKSKREATEYLNLAALASAVAVVYLHVNGCFWNYHPGAGYWKSANLIESLCYFAVPVFFMISGATLLDFFQRYSLRTYGKKRVIKTVLPYIIWSVFGLLFYRFYLGGFPVEHLDAAAVAELFLTGRSISIYWFFIPLFAAYLAIPLLAAVKEELRMRVFSYLAAVLFLTGTLIPFLLGVLGIPVNPDFFSLGMHTGYLMYLLLGYLLSHGKIPKNVRLLLYLLAAVGALLHICGTQILTIETGKISTVYKGYLNLPGVLYSTGVFLLFRYAGTRAMRNRICRSIVDWLRQYSFCIYLLHWYVLQVIARELKPDLQALSVRLVLPLLIVALVVAVSWLLRKIPLIRRYILP